MRKSCPRCSNPVQLAALGALSAEDGALKVTVEGMPAAKCAKGHASPVDNDIMVWLIHELKARVGALAAAEEKGMVFKKYLCACGGELAAKPERRQAFAQDFAYEGAPAFKGEIDAPVYKCGGCGKEMLRSHKSIQGHVAQAIASLNDAAGFPHSA
jgi:hypothetical protein